MKKINIFFIGTIIVYILAIFAFKYIYIRPPRKLVTKEYKLVTIQNDFIIINHNGNDIKLFPGDKYDKLIVNRILFSYAVINGKKYKVGDIIKVSVWELKNKDK